MAWWLTSIIPATQETKIKRIAVRGQHGQKVKEILFQQTSLSVIAYTCNPSHAACIEIKGQGQSEKKHKILSETKHTLERCASSGTVLASQAQGPGREGGSVSTIMPK
jgi:hypothetical protein